MMRDLILVFLGGGMGSMCRYGVGAYLLKSVAVRFPVATLMANALGCLLIGLLMGYLSNRPATFWSLLFVTGFCGGFTTFSTFSNETFQYFRQGLYGVALTYVALSLLLGLLMVALGFLVTKNL